jgi:hypothetical protein
MVRMKGSPRRQQRRSPPPGQPRVVETPLFKAAVREVTEQRARRLRTHFFNGRPYPRTFASAFQAGNGGASLDDGALGRGGGGGSFGSPGLEAGNGGPSVDKEEDRLRPTARGPWRGRRLRTLAAGP